MTNAAALNNRYEVMATLPRRQGRTLYLKYLRGESLTRGEAIKAKCYECVNGEDFKPCNVITCPLLAYCPYGHLELPINAKA